MKSRLIKSLCALPLVFTSYFGVASDQYSLTRSETIIGTYGLNLSSGIFSDDYSNGKYFVEDSLERGLASDLQGNLYVHGITDSLNRAPSIEGGLNVEPDRVADSGSSFLYKYNTKHELVYTAFFGRARIYDTVVDTRGRVYMIGRCGHAQAFLDNCSEFFVGKLSADGTTFRFSRLRTRPRAITLGEDNKLYVVGTSHDIDIIPHVTPSEDSPFANVLGEFNTYFSVIGRETLKTSYSALFGGTYDDIPDAIALDQEGGIYIAGQTRSADFNGIPSNNNSTDLFLVKLGDKGRSHLFTKILGGVREDFRASMQVFSGEVIIAGNTSSDDLITTPDALQPNKTGDNLSGFITRVDFQGNTTYSSYFGGDDTVVKGMGVGQKGIHLTGVTINPEFPVTTSAFQPYVGKSFFKPYVSQLNHAATELVYSTFFSGGPEGVFCDTSFQKINSIEVDVNDRMIVTGFSFSPDFPVYDRPWDEEDRSPLDNDFFAIFERNSLKISSDTMPPLWFETEYRHQLEVASGVPPFSWKFVNESSVPTGIALDKDTGVISGETSDFLGCGVRHLMVSVTDANNERSHKHLVLPLAERPSITLLSNGYTRVSEGESANFSPVSVRFGVLPYHFEVADGDLPPGLQVDSTSGDVKGVPTEPGTYFFSYLVADALGGVSTSEQIEVQVDENTTTPSETASEERPVGSRGSSGSGSVPLFLPVLLLLIFSARKRLSLK